MINPEKSAENEGLFSGFNGTGFPTFLIINVGEEIRMQMLYQVYTPQDFLKSIKAAETRIGIK